MQPRICMYIFVIQMKSKKERMETASKIKSILFKDFMESYKPNMTPNSNDFVMLIAGDDLGDGVLSKTFFAGNEISYASYLYNMIKDNENIRMTILGISELFINRNPQYIEQQMKMAGEFNKLNI